MGLRLVPQDDSSLVRREPGICRGPIRDGVKKGEEDGGPSGHHCARPLMNSSEPRNGGGGGGWQPVLPGKRLALEGCQHRQAERKKAGKSRSPEDLERL